MFSAPGSLEPPRLLTPSRIQQRLLEHNHLIGQEPPAYTEFLHTVLCHLGPPRRRTDSQLFERRSGRISVRFEAGALYDGERWVEQPLPYGVIPRLLMVHLSSEAVRTRQRTIGLGGSVRGFLAAIGVSTSGGPRGGYAALRRQLLALAACHITIGMHEGHRATTVDAKPIKRFEAWLRQGSNQRHLWPASIELSEAFYDTLIAHAVPLDHRALAALKHSALALDIYTWFAHRLCRVRNPQGVMLSWTNLRDQFGQEYGVAKDFKKAFRRSLRQVLVVYPGARVMLVHGGVRMYPSLPPIPQK